MKKIYYYIFKKVANHVIEIDTYGLIDATVKCLFFFLFYWIIVFGNKMAIFTKKKRKCKLISIYISKFFLAQPSDRGYYRLIGYHAIK